MSLRYILDGYNIMHHEAYRPTGRANDPKYGLIAFVRDRGFCGSAKNTALFVFDGFPSGFEYDDGRFRAVFSGSATADDRIKQFVEKSDRANVVVVSDDRELIEFARIHRARAERVADFLAERVIPADPDSAASKAELTYEKRLRIDKEMRERWLKE